MLDNTQSVEAIKRALSKLSEKSDWFKELVERVVSHEPFHGLDPMDIRTKIEYMNRENKFPNSVDGAFEALKKEFRIGAPKVNISDNPYPKKNFLEKFTLDDIDINKGLGLLAAGMAVFGAFDSAQHVLGKDEQGKNKINMTPLAWTLGQAAFAAGITYLTLKQPQLVTVATR